MYLHELSTVCSIYFYSYFFKFSFTATEHPTDQNTVVFKLKQECKRNPKATANETDPKKLYINHNGICPIFYSTIHVHNYSTY